MREKMAAGAVTGRRQFLKHGGIAGLGLASAAVVGAELGAFDRVSAVRRLGLGAPAVEAASLSADDIAVLQFALNLEYLEAEFYTYALTGMTLAERNIPVSGNVGTQGSVTGGMKVPFDELNARGPLRNVAEQLMHDEVQHVLLLRAVLGSEYTIAEPEINLNALVPMDTLQGFLTLARDFEVTGVSAYGGAVTLLTKAYLQTAAQIALVEALHSGNLQLLVDLNKISIAPLDGKDMVPPPAGPLFFDDSYNQALAVIRTPSEVLSIVYGNSSPGTSAGGFFPNGVNGQIRSV